MDYEEMSEPNMKLSRALLIVLVLHVVAVAGIIAFNTIKTRQGSLAADFDRSDPGNSLRPRRRRNADAAQTLRLRARSEEPRNERESVQPKPV